MEKTTVLNKVKELLEKVEKRKFKQTIDLNINFEGIDVEDTKYKLNLNVFLPKGRGRDVEVGVFADGDMSVRAKKVSKHVYSKADVEELGKTRKDARKIARDCYAFIAQPELMPLIGKNLGIVLAPRGKMPQPVPPNADLDSIVSKIKNSVKVKTKKSPTIHVPVGTEDMTAEDLTENIMEVLSAIGRQITEEHFKSVYIKTTMSPAVKVW